MSKNDKKSKKGYRLKQTLVLNLLLEGKSYVDAARSVGVTRQTIGNWMHDSRFRATFNRMQKKRMEQITKKYRVLEDKSFEVITNLLDDPTLNPSIKLRAAEIVQREARHHARDHNLVPRIEAIEDWKRAWDRTVEKDIDWVSMHKIHELLSLEKEFGPADSDSGEETADDSEEPVNSFSEGESNKGSEDSDGSVSEPESTSGDDESVE